ncbi:hypothetical protein ACFE04_030516 [Oxalis oulophora]
MGGMFSRPDCLKPNNKRNNKSGTKMKRKSQQKNGKNVTKGKNREVTLEDWLKASPGSEYLNGGELYVLKQSSKRIHPSTSASEIRHSKISTPGNSFRSSSDGCSMEFGSSFRRSQSGKSQKKVSFKLPEKDDIILFYSSEETPETEIQDIVMLIPPTREEH